MGDTTYRVVLAMETSGSLGAGVASVGDKIGRAHDRAVAFHHALHSTGDIAEQAFHRIGGMVEHVADSLLHVAEAGAAIGGGALFAGAIYGVGHLNNELEQTQISLGAIFQAQGFDRDFTKAFARAGDQLSKMKQDVKTLPGDLGQLSDIMKMIATPAAQGGLTPDAIRALAGKTMLVGTILGVQQDMAAREMASLLAGRAGSHNILGGRLGLIGEEAKAFNAKSASGRVEEVEQLLGKYQGATDRFAQSFVANWTTLKDNIKYGFMADATAPVFESVKTTLASINHWFDDNQDKVKSWASAFGAHFKTTWEGLTEEAVKFGPALENGGRQFFVLWDEAIAKAHEFEPIIAKIGAALERVSAHDVMGGVKDIAELKLAGMGLHAAGSAIGAAGTGLRLVDSWSRVMGSGVGVGGSGAVAATGAEAIGSIGIALPALAVGALAAAGAIDILTNNTSKYHNEAKRLADEIGSETMSVWTQLADTARPAVSALHEFGDYLGLGLMKDIEMATGTLQGFGDFLRYAYRDVVGKLGHPGESDDDMLARAKFNASRDIGGPIADQFDPTALRLASTSLLDAALGRDEQKKKLPGGGGGTNIQKVEIVVKGSDDPSRFARLAMAEIAKLGRNPTRSAHVADIASAR